MFVGARAAVMEHVKMTLGWLDNTVFVLMLVMSTVIGVYFAYCSPGGNMSAAQYLVGGRTMGTIPIALSLIARYCAVACKMVLTKST